MGVQMMKNHRDLSLFKEYLLEFFKAFVSVAGVCSLSALLVAVAGFAYENRLDAMAMTELVQWRDALWSIGMLALAWSIVAFLILGGIELYEDRGNGWGNDR